MTSSKTKQEQEYQSLASQHQPKPKVLLNCLKAFLVGGLICVIGQALQLMYLQVVGLPEYIASNVTVVTLVLIACLLTGWGVYDNIGQWAGAGSAVPVTGFANAMASAALEHKSEGYVLGVGGKMFKLAGSVIVFGVVAAFFVSIIRTLYYLIMY